jgi:hypothetical protein
MRRPGRRFVLCFLVLTAVAVPAFAHAKRGRPASACDYVMWPRATMRE